MSKLTYGEIIKELVDAKIEVGSFVWSSIDEYRSQPKFPKSLGTVKTVKQAVFEDYEEQSRQDEDTHVTHFVDHDVYIATTIRMNSYGSDPTFPFGYGREVKPIVKPTTFYE